MFSVQAETRGPSRLWTDVLESVAVTTEARGSLTSAAWLLSKLLSVLNHSRLQRRRPRAVPLLSSAYRNDIKPPLNLLFSDIPSMNVKNVFLFWEERVLVTKGQMLTVLVYI